jgi:ubiquinone/menaquinone biosynthesis C-methylase UbiE
MENPKEAVRLHVKTDPEALRNQAIWCGVQPGIRILDAGCGSGKASAILHEMIQPNGSLLAIDSSTKRITYAKKNFGGQTGLEFRVCDFTHSLDELGQFDLIWMRFILEYFRNNAFEILNNLTACLKPGGFLCLLDLDHNGLNHYPLPDGMGAIMDRLMERLEAGYNFDPYAGRKLYTYLYDLSYTDIQVQLLPHHLIYGALKPEDHYNWIMKLSVISQKVFGLFEDYPGGQDGFFDDFSKFLNDPRRFIYSPLIMAKGKKPI